MREQGKRKLMATVGPSLSGLESPRNEGRLLNMHVQYFTRPPRAHWVVALVVCFSVCSCSRTVQPPIVPTSVDLGDLKQRAEAGDVEAQTHLAKCYAEGKGTAPDYKLAVHWYGAAAEHGNADAQAGLGELLEAGQGLPRNMPEAARLYRLAAEHGSVAGQYNLANLYEQGRHFKVDQVEASKWYRLAAEGGDALAQFDIGQRYHLGVGVPVDPVESLFWLEVAAMQGQPDAAELKKRVADKLSRSEIREARARSKSFKPR